MSKTEAKLTPEEEDEKIEKEFVAEQLIKIAVGMDMSDNAGSYSKSSIFNQVHLLIFVVGPRNLFKNRILLLIS